VALVRAGQPESSQKAPLCGSLASVTDSVEKRFWTSPGGKASIAKQLAKLLPSHRVYVEPFAGSAAVLFAKDAAGVEVLNDADPSIARAYTIIKGLDDARLRKLSGMVWLGSKKTFDLLAKAEPKGDLEWLHWFLYTRRFSYGKKGPKSGFDPSAEGASSTAPSRIAKNKDRLKGAIILNRDYAGVIEEYDAPDAVHFLDPPYAGHNVGIGETKFDEAEFLAVLKKIKGKFVLTYGIRGELPRLLRKDGSFTIKKLRTRRAFANMKGSDAGSKVLEQLLVLNFNADVKKAIDPDIEVLKSLPGEHAAQQFAPTKGRKFHRVHPRGWPAGIDAVIETIGDKSKIQSVRADKLKWSVGDFKRWLRKNDLATKHVEAADVSKAIENPSDEKRTDLPPDAYAAPFYAKNDGSYDPERGGEFIPSKSKLPHHVNTVKQSDDDESVDLPRLRAARQRFDQTDWSIFGPARERVKVDARADIDGHARRLLSSVSAGVEKAVAASCADANDASLVATLKALLLHTNAAELTGDSNDAVANALIAAGSLLFASAAHTVTKRIQIPVESKAIDIGCEKAIQQVFAAGCVAKALLERIPAKATVVRNALNDVAVFSKALAEKGDPISYADLVGEQVGEEAAPSVEVSVIKSSVEGKYALGVVLEPNDQEAGLDPDAQNDIYSEAEVRNAFEWYTRNSLGNVDLMHDGRLLSVNQVRVLDNYTAPVGFKIGNESVKKGTWLQGIEVLDPEIQKAIRSGKFRAYSVAGEAVRTKEKVKV